MVDVLERRTAVSSIMPAKTVEGVRSDSELLPDVSSPEVLGEIVLFQQGTFSRVRRYLRGWHPEAGTLHSGWQGPETIAEKDVIKPLGVFQVRITCY